jgi:hypothetical protein
MRIYIIGVSGSGKTTLGSKLGYLYSYPVYNLDALAEDVSGNILPANEIIKKMNLGTEHWVVEGEFVLKEVLKRADRIIWLRASITRTVIQLWKRYFTAGGTSREISLGQTLGLIWSSIGSILFSSSIDEKKLGFIPVANYADVLEPYAKKLVIIRRYDPTNITSVVKALASGN